jgi:hypothetical protein
VRNKNIVHLGNISSSVKQLWQNYSAEHIVGTPLFSLLEHVTSIYDPVASILNRPELCFWRIFHSYISSVATRTCNIYQPVNFQLSLGFKKSREWRLFTIMYNTLVPKMTGWKGKNYIKPSTLLVSKKPSHNSLGVSTHQIKCIMTVQALSLESQTQNKLSNSICAYLIQFRQWENCAHMADVWIGSQLVPCWRNDWKGVGRDIYVKWHDISSTVLFQTLVLENSRKKLLLVLWLFTI